MVTRLEQYLRNSIRHYRADLAGLSLSSGVALELTGVGDKRVSLTEFVFNSTGGGSVATIQIARQELSSGGTRAAVTPGKHHPGDTTFGGTLFAYSAASTNEGAILDALASFPLSSGTPVVRVDFPMTVESSAEALTLRLTSSVDVGDGYIEFTEEP